MLNKRQSATTSKQKEKLEETLRSLILQITSLSRDVFVKRVDQIPTVLENNNRALRLLNEAAQFVQIELQKCSRPKLAPEAEHRRALRRSIFSWELIPGISSTKHCFSPLDFDDADKLLEYALKTRNGVLIIGNSGQGKTMLIRFVLQKIARVSVYVDTRDIVELNLIFNRFAELRSAVLVLDNVELFHCRAIRQNLPTIRQHNVICVITSDDEVLNQLSDLMCSMRIPDPCAQHLARLYTLLVRGFHSTPKCIPPSCRTRLAIVRSLQMEMLDANVMKKGDYVEASSEPPGPPQPPDVSEEHPGAYYVNKCLASTEQFRKLERNTPPRKRTKGKKPLKKKKKTKKKDQRKPKSRMKECFTV